MKCYKYFDYCINIYTLIIKCTHVHIFFKNVKNGSNMFHDLSNVTLFFYIYMSWKHFYTHLSWINLNGFIFTFFFIQKKKLYWNSENFLCPVFYRFARLWISWLRFCYFCKIYVYLFVCVWHNLYGHFTSRISSVVKASSCNFFLKLLLETSS